MKFILVAVLSCIASLTIAQTKTETITQQFTFPKSSDANTILVENINGKVKVVGYAGTQVVIEIHKKVSALNSELLQRAMGEVQPGIIEAGDSLVLFTNGICQTFSTRLKQSRDGFGRFGYEWNKCHESEPGFDYTLDYTIRVPLTTNVSVSTINEGDVSVENVTGKVYASNINGGITLSKVTRVTRAHTINGNVDVRYSGVPAENCSFYTLNGDINAYVRKDFSSDVSFKSFNGDFFTDFQNLESLPPRVEKAGGNGVTQLKISGNYYRIGKGGIAMHLETFNGNAYLRGQ